MTPRLALALALLTTAIPATAQHAGDYVIASSADGGGTLMALAVDAARTRASTDIRSRIYALACTPLTGVDVCSGTDPGFDAWPLGVAPVAGVTYFPVAAGTAVDLELTAVDPDTFLQLGGITLDTAGDVGRIGEQVAEEGGMHLHPAWSLVVPSGQLAERALSFRLTSPSPAYAASSVYTLTITNDPTPPTTTLLGSTTSTSVAGGTTTTTTLPDPCAGHPAGSPAAIACALEAVGAAIDGVGLTPPRLARRLQRKHDALARAIGRLGDDAPPRLGARAERALRRFARWVERRAARLPAGFATTLLARGDDLGAQLAAARSSGDA